MKKILTCLLATTLIACINKNYPEAELTRSSALAPIAPTTSHKEIFVSPDSIQASALEDEVSFVIGNQLLNPYNIVYMDSAYDYLVDHKIIVNTLSRPKSTHVYFRVLPTTTGELEELLQDTKYDFSDVPYDYEILNPDSGTYYHDPNCDSGVTWLYSVVPIEAALPNMRNVEIIYYCHIPEFSDKDSDEETEAKEMLEYTAFRLTGNLDYYDEDITNAVNARYQVSNNNIKRAAKKRHQVHGKISVQTMEYQNKTSPSPLQYAHIRLNVFTKVEKIALNGNGEFQSQKKFLCDPHLTIIFKNALTGDEIWGGWHWRSSAYKKIEERVPAGGLSYTIPFDDISWRWATVNNAVVTKYEMDHQLGIEAPTNLRLWIIAPSNSNNWGGSTPLLRFANSSWHRLAVAIPPLAFITTPIAVTVICGLSPTLAAIYNTATSIAVFTRMPDVFLFYKQNEANCYTSTIFSDVFHELAHASHYMQVGDEYWSQYISYIIEHRGYGSAADANSGYCGVGEAWAWYAGEYYETAFNNGNTLNLSTSNGIINDLWWNRGILPYINNNVYSPYNIQIGALFDAFNASATDFSTLEYNLINIGVPSSIIQQAKNSTQHDWY